MECCSGKDLLGLVVRAQAEVAGDRTRMKHGHHRNRLAWLERSWKQGRRSVVVELTSVRRDKYREERRVKTAYGLLPDIAYLEAHDH